MSIMKLGALGEFFGAIAVAVTLVYLVVQIRQNTKTLKSSIYTDWASLSSTVHMMVANNVELFATVYSEPDRKFRELNREQQVAHHALWHTNMNVYESLYLNYLQGTVDESVFEAKHRTLVNFLATHSLHRQTWHEYGERIYDRRFVDYVNDKIMPAVE